MLKIVAIDVESRDLFENGSKNVVGPRETGIFVGTIFCYFWGKNTECWGRRREGRKEGRGEEEKEEEKKEGGREGRGGEEEKGKRREKRRKKEEEGKRKEGGKRKKGGR